MRRGQPPLLMHNATPRPERRMRPALGSQRGPKRAFQSLIQRGLYVSAAQSQSASFLRLHRNTDMFGSSWTAGPTSEGNPKLIDKIFVRSLQNPATRQSSDDLRTQQASI